MTVLLVSLLINSVIGLQLHIVLCTINVTQHCLDQAAEAVFPKKFDDKLYHLSKIYSGEHFSSMMNLENKFLINFCDDHTFLLFKV